MKHHDYVVITSSRTGSTWLIDILNEVPGVASYGELFLGHGRLAPAIATRADYPRFCESRPRQCSWRPISVWAYLDQLFQLHRHVGFKLMYSQLRAFPEVIPYCAFRRIRVLHLIRRNLVDVIISDELAKATGQSHQSGEPGGSPMVYLDPATLVQRLRVRDRSVNRARWLLRLSTCRCLEVGYEKLTEGAGEFARIQDFLGIEGELATVRSKLSKRGRQEHSKAIINYGEVRQLLSSTRFADMVR
jgi:LPS sulfotransferase NodH